MNFDESACPVGTKNTPQSRTLKLKPLFVARALNDLASVPVKADGSLELTPSVSRRGPGFKQSAIEFFSIECCIFITV